jgi:hypothetical protein
LFVILSFDGKWPQPESLAIEYFFVHGSLPELSQLSEDAARLHEARA